MWASPEAMNTSLKVVAGVAVTSLLLGIVGTVTMRHRIGVRGIALLAAIPSAVAWAVASGVWDWQHRTDPEHIRNYPLTLHDVSVIFVAVLYGALGFVVAFGVATLLERLRGRGSNTLACCRHVDVRETIRN